MEKDEYRIVGMMSGTSLDGIDLVLCHFIRSQGNWHYKILKAETFSYSKEWKEKLRKSVHLDAESFLQLHNSYGEFIGERIRTFTGSRAEKIDFAAVHGHTIFHQPERRFTFQLGAVASVAVKCGLPVIGDFRTFDVALQGQGAPLVPAGDKLLFSGYDFCLNLGGFANISHDVEEIRVACDLCPVNIVANQLALSEGFEFDPEGSLGAQGSIIPEILEQLNSLPFYFASAPKSLGREWVDHEFMPVLNAWSNKTMDKLRTLYEHIAVQTAYYVNRFPAGKVLTTGGGAFNSFLMDRIRSLTKSEIIIPDKVTVEYKEAVIFAFLGLLRFLNEINTFASVTGAKSDSSGGIIYGINFFNKANGTGIK